MLSNFGVVSRDWFKSLFLVIVLRSVNTRLRAQCEAALDHLLHLVEGIEDEMAIAGVPQPWLLHALCSQANELLHLQVKKVRPVLRPLHLGMKSLLSGPDLEDAIHDQHLIVVLI